MGEDLMRKLLEARKQENNQYVSFHYDGSVSVDDKSYYDGVLTFGSFSSICSTLYDAAKSYSKYGEYDKINMRLVLGLVYDGKYVNPDKTLKANAVPMDKIVHFYTDSVNSYLNDEKTNEKDYYNYGFNRQGFIEYNDLVKQIKKEGLVFNGPANFAEFKNLMLKGENFEVSIEANLKKEKTLSLRKW